MAWGPTPPVEEKIHLPGWFGEIEPARESEHWQAWTGIKRVSVPLMTASASLKTPTVTSGVRVELPSSGPSLPYQLPFKLGPYASMYAQAQMLPAVKGTGSHHVDVPVMTASAQLPDVTPSTSYIVQVPGANVLPAELPFILGPLASMHAGASLGEPTPSVSTTVAAPVMGAAAVMGTPTVDVQTLTIVSAPRMVATASLGTPAVTSSVTVAAPRLGAAAAVLTPTVSSSALVSAPRMAATASMSAPTAIVKNLVQFDAFSIGGSGGTSTRSWAHSLDGNCIVVVFTNTTSSGATCTYGGVNIPRVYGPSSDGGVFPYTSYISIFALVSDSLPQGSNTVSVNQAGTASAGTAMSFRGAESIGSVINDTSSGNISQSLAANEGRAAVAGYVGGSSNFGTLSPNQAANYGFTAFVTWSTVAGWATDDGSGINFSGSHSGAKTGAVVPILPP